MTDTYHDLAKRAADLECVRAIVTKAGRDIKSAELGLGRLEVVLPPVMGFGVAVSDGILALDSLGRFALLLRKQLSGRLDELYKLMEAMPEHKQ